MATQTPVRKREHVSAVRLLTTLPKSLSAEFDRLVAYEHSTASATIRRILALTVPKELARYEHAIRKINGQANS